MLMAMKLKMKTVLFSNCIVFCYINGVYLLKGSYEIQDCDVSSDQHTSSILVECTFAINSTAPGIVVIQDGPESIYHQQDTAETAAG